MSQELKLSYEAGSSMNEFDKKPLAWFEQKLGEPKFNTQEPTGAKTARFSFASLKTCHLKAVKKIMHNRIELF